MKATVPMIYADMPTFMGQPYAFSPDDLKGADAVIIGSPYVAGWKDYAAKPREEWASGVKKVRQQSIKYRSGYVQEFDVDVFEHLKVVDFGDANVGPGSEVWERPTADNILKAQREVETKVTQVLEAGAVPIIIGENSPCGSYAVAKPLAERVKGNVGAIVMDTHWDSEPFDEFTRDPRIAGQASWKTKMYEFHKNMLHKNLVEIGERGLWESKETVREMLRRGTHWYPMWKVREIGIKAVCDELHYAYDGTEAVFVHIDTDVTCGHPAYGDLIGDLAEPIGMTDYELLRLSHEIGKRGFDAFTIVGTDASPVFNRLLIYAIMYALAGKIVSKK